jgi:hypothetical protein
MRPGYARGGRRAAKDHSFIAQMLGDNRTRESRLRAVAPVSSSLYNNPSWSPIPTLLTHGLNDQMRLNDLNGAMDISQYAKSNQGGATFDEGGYGPAPSSRRGGAREYRV